MKRTGTTLTTNDACNPLTPGSLTGKVALIRRGTCYFIDKINNAANAGAVGVVIYNNSDSALMVMGTTATAPIPAVFITKADGAIIDTRLQTGPVTMTWTNLVTSPVINSVTSTTANGTYGLGSAISITLNFNEPVTIATDALSVVLNTGAILKPSAPLSPPIASSVSTTYTVQANERTTDLTVTSITGTITNIEGVSTVNPTIPAGKNLGDTKDIVIIQKFPWPMFLPAITTAVQ